MREEKRARREGGRPLLSRHMTELILHGAALDTRLAETALGMSWTPLSVTLDRFDAWARGAGLIPDGNCKEVRT